jgi:hypothetical protein
LTNITSIILWLVFLLIYICTTIIFQLIKLIQSIFIKIFRRPPPYMPTLERLKGRGSRVCHEPPQKIVFQKDAKWCILSHFGYKICSVKSLNIVWKNHEKMEISILHIYKSNLGPSNSDGSNTMGGSNLFESPANFTYIFKLKKLFRSNTDTSYSRT